jgi:hypothetical protein
VPVADRAPPRATTGPAGRTGRAALLATGGSIALVWVTGLLGTSAAQPPLPGGPGWLPPYRLGLDPSPELVTGLLLAAVALGAAGLGLGLRALHRGWQPSPHRLLAASGAAVAAMVTVPPMGSADHLVYAAYGRLAATGGDPYAQTARDLAAAGDPVGRAVEAPWQDTPSLYGPYGTAEQWLASVLGGDSPRATVFVLQLLGAAAFIVTGLLVQRLAGPAPTHRARAALLWSLNPLLLFVVVNAAHIDGFALVWAAAALVAVRRSPALAGVLAGVACGVKLSLALYVLALAWGLRQDLRRAAVLLAAAGATVLAGYAPIGLHGFDQLRTASRLVSFGTPWRLTVGPLEAVLDADLARTLIGLGGWALLALLVWLLVRVLPPPGPAADPRRSALRAAALLTFAWLLAAPYSLPWYDAAAWLPFAALTGAGVLDYLLLARTAVLTAGYVPGRAVDLPGAVDLLARNLRGTLAPVVGLVLLAAVIRLGLAARRPPPRPRPAEQPS